MNPLTRVFPAYALLAGSCLLISCGDSAGTGPPEQEPPGPATMVVAPEQVTVNALGDTVQFTATVWDGEGRVLPDATLNWYSSDEAVATISETGLATAVGDGGATILAAASASVFGWGEMAVTAKPMAIVTSGLRPGVVGLPYSQFLVADGVISPTWSIMEGVLPDGLALNGGTGEISGTPTLPGESPITVQLSEGEERRSKNLLLVVVQEDLGVGFEEDQFSLIPAGSFQMGSDDGGAHEQPVHTVNITRPFLMQKTEVTQYQWTTVMGGNPSVWPNCGDICPVEMISWDEVQLFSAALNEMDPGKNYRLPTEAQWEYAARAGTTGDYGGTGIPLEMGWFVENGGSRTHFVAQKEPNAWGLYDMHGNVSEWIQDWGSPTYYSESPSDDPTGPSSGDFRVYRGGNSLWPASRATSWSRGWSFPYTLSASFGFRLVRDP
jgi:hypothetical protein